jgi:hypothetical protein
MSKKAESRALAAVQGRGGALAAVSAMMQERFGAAAGWRVAPAAQREPKPLHSLSLIVAADTGISPDRRRVYYSQRIGDRESGTAEIQISVWRTDTLRCEHVFAFSDIAGWVPESNKKENKADCFRTCCFMGNDHLVLGAGTGTVRILSLAEKTVWAEEHIGGVIECVTCSGQQLAACVFPGGDDSDDVLCGIYLYSIEDIVRRKCFTLDQLLLPRYLPFWPNKIQLTRDGGELLCRGATYRTKGYKNYCGMYRIAADEYLPLLEEKDTEQSHYIAELTGKGMFAMKSRTQVAVYDSQCRQQWSIEIPEDMREGNGPTLHLSDAGRRLLLQRNGQIFLADRETPPRRILEHAGWITYGDFLSETQVLIFLCENDWYELAVADIDTGDIVRSTTSHTGIEHIMPEAYAPKADGGLILGDRQGFVRTFSPGLEQTARRQSPWGAVRKAVQDPFSSTVAMACCSHGVITCDTADPCLKTYVSRADHKPVEVNSGYRNIWFPTVRPGMLVLSGGASTINAYDDGSRGIEIRSKDDFKKVLISDNIDHVHETVDSFMLDMPAVAGCEVRGRALVLQKDGSLFALDPFAYELEDRGEEKILKPGGSHIVSVLQGIAEPGGMCSTEAGGLALWTADRVILLELDEHFSIAGRREKPCSSVRNIKWDRVNRRLILAFDHFLSFWTTGLEEMCRLYLMPGGGYLLHVPYPGRLQAEGGPADHPGFYAAVPQRDDVLEVYDRKGETIADREEAAAYLEQHRSRFMIAEALRNYEQFCCNLAPAYQPAGAAAAVRMLCQG